MKVLLDFDYYALYAGGNDTTQATADLNTVKTMVASIKAKFKSSVEDLRSVLACLDEGKTGEHSLRCCDRIPRSSLVLTRVCAGYLSAKDFLSGCAALGVTLNDAEEVYVRNLVETDAQGAIKWEDFIGLF